MTRTLPLAPSESALLRTPENLRLCPRCDQLIGLDVGRLPVLRQAPGTARRARLAARKGLPKRASGAAGIPCTPGYDGLTASRNIAWLAVFYESSDFPELQATRGPPGPPARDARCCRRPRSRGRGRAFRRGRGRAREGARQEPGQPEAGLFSEIGVRMPDHRPGDRVSAERRWQGQPLQGARQGQDRRLEREPRKAVEERAKRLRKGGANQRVRRGTDRGHLNPAEEGQAQVPAAARLPRSSRSSRITGSSRSSPCASRCGYPRAASSP